MNITIINIINPKLCHLQIYNSNKNKMFVFYDKNFLALLFITYINKTILNLG